MELLRTALRLSGYWEDDFSHIKHNHDNKENDLEQVECIVANLISQGALKGYISHERRIVVLSNKEAFPARGPRSA
jgi:hypothetical protein